MIPRFSPRVALGLVPEVVMGLSQINVNVAAYNSQKHPRTSSGYGFPWGPREALQPLQDAVL